MRKIEKAITAEDPEAADKVQSVQEAYWEDRAAKKCTFQRAEEWFEKKAQPIENKAKTIEKTKREQEMEECKKGAKK